MFWRGSAFVQKIEAKSLPQGVRFVSSLIVFDILFSRDTFIAFQFRDDVLRDR